jgi:hypothetical protein
MADAQPLGHGSAQASQDLILVTHQDQIHVPIAGEEPQGGRNDDIGSNVASHGVQRNRAPTGHGGFPVLDGPAAQVGSKDDGAA